MDDRLKFSQRHPFLFALIVLATAMVLFMGIMAVFQFKLKDMFLAKNRIGVVNIKGSITDSRQIVNWINELRRDGRIKGIIIRINSPGGSVAASQEIYQVIRETARVKPVVVSMGDIAASGGYYVACGATKIVANPGTITGSIGVIAKFANIKRLLNKLGIKDETITSGKFKATGSMTRDLSQEEREYIQALVNDLHDQFVEAVANGRKMPVDKVRRLANGKVFTGRQAKKLGLVDILGGFSTAVKTIKGLCHIKDEVVLVEGPKRGRSLWSLVFGEESSLLGVKDYICRRILCIPY